MKVLVVEDDADIQDIVISVLSRAGYDVLAEDNGDAGLAAALTQQPDLVILDWMMPGLTGVEVCRAMRADPRAKNVRPAAHVRAQEADIDQAFTAGADDYMVKPFRGRELVSRVNSLTAKNVSSEHSQQSRCHARRRAANHPAPHTPGGSRHRALGGR